MRTAVYTHEQCICHRFNIVKVPLLLVPAHPDFYHQVKLTDQAAFGAIPVQSSERPSTIVSRGAAVN